MRNYNGSSQALRFIRCSIAAETYCLHMSWVRGIQRLEMMRPNTEAHGPAGWLASSGEEVPIFRLATLLKRPFADDQPGGKIIMLKTSPRPWGILVDRVESIIHVQAEAVFSLPEIVQHPGTDWFDGVVQYEDTLFLSLAPEGLHPDVHSYVATPLLQAYGYKGVAARPALHLASGPRRRLLSFTTTPVQGEASCVRFGLSVSQVPQVLQTFTVTAVAGAAEGVLGLTQWRSGPLAVIDLEHCLGGARVSMTPAHRLLIARTTTAQTLIGIPILPQVRIHQFPLAYRASTRPMPFQEALTRGRFDGEHDTLVIPDIDRILHTYSQRLA
jgi:chemotaxis signal transduction protein